MKCFSIFMGVSFFLPVVLFSGSATITFEKAMVKAALQGMLFSDFNQVVNFENRVGDVPLTLDSLEDIVDDSLKEYQLQSEPVILPCRELKKEILRCLLNNNGLRDI